MEIIAIFGFAIVFFLVVAGVIISVIRRRVKESWKGKITDKKVEVEVRKGDDFDRKVDVFCLYVKLEDGTSKKVSVGKKLYDSFSVGDTIEKAAGKYDPVKVS